MQYYRCQCGKREAWTSMGAGPDCQGCEECQTTFAQNAASHKALQPHDYSIEKFNQDTGKKFMLCSKCYEPEPVSYAASKIRD